MNSFYDDLTEICEILAEELKKTNDKLDKAGGEISAGDLEYIDKLTHAIKSVKTTKAMLDAEEGMSYDDGMTMSNARNSRNSGRGSYGRSRGRSNRRDSMGRYSSRGGYSRDNEEMVDELYALMEDAPDERTKQEFQRFIQKVEQMK